MKINRLFPGTASRSISHLIAWLSVCMMAAAWGSLLGAEWTRLWMLWGTFGIIAAVGLELGDRCHLAYRHRTEENAAIDRLEHCLSAVAHCESDQSAHQGCATSDHGDDSERVIPIFH